MLDLLEEAELELHEWLEEPDSWSTLYIDYEPPTVLRLWRPWKDGRRFMLHCIKPVGESEQALYHPHPWPSAVHVLYGQYEMLIGHEDMTPGSSGKPRPVAKFVLGAGSKYEMTQRSAWHYVKPLGEDSFSTMLIGKRNREIARPLKPLRELTKAEKAWMLGRFRELAGW